MRKVLITGATGFIGSHVTDACLERGDRVRALVLPDDPAGEALERRGVEVRRGSITDYSAVRDAAEGSDVIFHTAALVTDWAPRRLFREVTLGGAENICRAALKAGVSRLVDISTNDVFGLDESEVMDETFPFRPWGEPYPDFKIKAEEIVRRYHRDEGLPVAIVYPCWVYGERDRTFVPDLADAIIKRDLMFWRRDVLVWPTYIRNLVDLMMIISEDPRAVGNGYIAHDGVSVTLQDFCAEIAGALGVPAVTTHIPYGLAYAAAVLMESAWNMLRIRTRPLLTTYIVKNLGSRLRFSIEKARRDLGWVPRVSYREGMAETMAWLRTLDRSTLKSK